MQNYDTEKFQIQAESCYQPLVIFEQRKVPELAATTAKMMQKILFPQ